MLTSVHAANYSLARPVEFLELHISPSDFFTKNPAIDVPSNKDIGSKLANSCCDRKTVSSRL